MPIDFHDPANGSTYAQRVAGPEWVETMGRSDHQPRDLLEAALSQRPGRVDLAVEIPLPDEPARRALLGLYTRDLPVTVALDDAAGRCGGVTASFFKELARRTVLIAADADHRIDDTVLADAVTEMLSDTEQLTRALLGGTLEGQGNHALPDAGHWHLGACPGRAP